MIIKRITAFLVHLFCPFGLLSWLFEKLSIYKIRVNYETCTLCDACVNTCPSEAMGAILGKKKRCPTAFPVRHA